MNWAEVLTKMQDLGQAPEDVSTTLANQGVVDEALTICPFDEGMAQAVARLRPLTRSFGLSLGDRACLALGIRLGVPVLTCDRAWAELAVGVSVQAIR